MENLIKHLNVLNFIDNFKGEYPSILEKIFTQGCCYWFALILKERFKKYNPKICFDTIESHFACKIDDRYYDITGEINNISSFVDWETYPDETHKKRIIRYCVNKE